MTTLKSVAIIAALLAGGTSLAIAQNGASANSKGTSRTATSAATTLRGTDTVILSGAQRSAIWNDLSKQATNQNAAGLLPALLTIGDDRTSVRVWNLSSQSWKRSFGQYHPGGRQTRQAPRRNRGQHQRAFQEDATSRICWTRSPSPAWLLMT
jgi:hypothetical protein